MSNPSHPIPASCAAEVPPSTETYEPETEEVQQVGWTTPVQQVLIALRAT